MKTLALLVLVIASALGHSYISRPMSRTNQGQSQTGCRGPSCVGPCDGTQPANRGTVQRGSTIDVRWPRNNHPGGFIRFAWAPTGESNSHAAFDSRVSLVTCHERGTVAGGVCAPGNGGDPNGGDSKSAGNPEDHCRANVVVPSWLTDGQWTLQWAWFGGGFFLGDYYSCVDYTVSGGVGVTGQSGPSFEGGDFGNPGGSVCKTFNTDALHRCNNEPCDNAIFYGQIRNVAPAGITGGSQTPPPLPPPPPPTPSPNGNCYANPGAAKNLGVAPSSTCGTNNPGGRCADNMCCSKFGYCGGTIEYCENNQGDWRVTPCVANGGICYKSTNAAQLNLDGAISRTGQCGSSLPNSRCADGQCCSRHGFCGVGATYCDANQGDWSLTTCNGVNNISPRDAIFSNSTTDLTDDTPLIGSSGKVILGLLSAAAVAL